MILESDPSLVLVSVDGITLLHVAGECAFAQIV